MEPSSENEFMISVTTVQDYLGKEVVPTVPTAWQLKGWDGQQCEPHCNVVNCGEQSYSTVSASHRVLRGGRV